MKEQKYITIRKKKKDQKWGGKELKRSINTRKNHSKIEDKNRGHIIANKYNR